MSNAIELRHLRYRAGPGFSIEDLTLVVPGGSIFGFPGPNGSGKTTTIRLPLGQLRAASGNIVVPPRKPVPPTCAHVSSRSLSAWEA